MEHKWPVIAFVVLIVVAAAVLGNGLRASAESFQMVASEKVSLHTSSVYGSLTNPSSRSTRSAGATAKPGATAPDVTAREELVPMAQVVADAVAPVATTPALYAITPVTAPSPLTVHGAPRHAGTVASTPLTAPAKSAGPISAPQIAAPSKTVWHKTMWHKTRSDSARHTEGAPEHGKSHDKSHGKSHGVRHHKSHVLSHGHGHGHGRSHR